MRKVRLEWIQHCILCFPEPQPTGFQNMAEKELKMTDVLSSSWTLENLHANRNFLLYNHVIKEIEAAIAQGLYLVHIRDYNREKVYDEIIETLKQRGFKIDCVGRYKGREWRVHGLYHPAATMNVVSGVYTGDAEVKPDVKEWFETPIKIDERGRIVN